MNTILDRLCIVRRGSSGAMGIALALVVLGMMLTGCGKPPESPKGTPTAQSPPATNSALDAVLGQYQLNGKVTLVQFGQVGCKLSDEGLGRMIWIQTNNALPELGLLRVEGNADAGAVDAYYKTKAPAFAVHRDGQAALAKAVGATATPTCVLVDKFGHPRYFGSYPEEKLDEWVKMLAAEKADPGEGAVMLGVAALDVPKLLAKTALPMLSGEPAKALSAYKGEAGLLIVFVDVSCPFSAKAMQDLPTVAPKLAARKIPTVLVNLDDALDAVQAHYADNKLGLPVLYDVTTATKNNWGVHSVPTLVFVTADGQQAGYNGNAVWKNLATAIEQDMKAPAGSIQLDAVGTAFG